MKANIKFKNSAFSYLYSSPDTLRELYKGFSFDVIQEITGLDIETIKNLSNSEGAEN